MPSRPAARVRGQARERPRSQQAPDEEADDRPSSRPPKAHRWQVINWAVLAPAALLLSMLSLIVASLTAYAQHERQREEFARQVVFVAAEGAPNFLVGAGSKPEVGETTFIVANFGQFPIEDVIIEGAPGTIELEGGLELPERVDAIRIGVVGPCQSVSVVGGEYTHATFSDITGQAWMREPASPPTDDLPAPEVERSFPDIRSPSGATIEQMDNCR